MPIYEYRCKGCRNIFQRLILHEKEEAHLRCPDCGGKEFQRLISRVAYHVSESDRLADFNPGAHRDDSFFKDSRNIGLQAKKRAQQMGVDLGSGFEEKLEKLRTDPGSVIKDSE
jgi:putative FmdB family regulatory protein